MTKKNCFLVVLVFLLLGVIGAVTWAVGTQSKPPAKVTIRTKKKAYRPYGYYRYYPHETQKQREKRLRERQKAKEAREQLRMFRERRREKFEAMQAEVKRRKLDKNTVKKSPIAKIAMLERKVNILEQRVNLLENIIMGEDPNPLFEEAEQEQSEPDKPEKNKF